MPSDQTQTPLIDAIKAVSRQHLSVFYVPGHKRGQGIPSQLSDWLGAEIFRADLPELPEFGSLFPPQGTVKTAQELAAEAFGAKQTWFLANGSTSGVEAAILATCRQGDKIILPRNVHKSAISGLVLSGAMPIFVNPECDRNLPTSITPKTLKTALETHPDVKAVMVVYPTYHGICGDLGAIASLVHQYNIPLLVDEAHGAHFAFHPNLPASALSLGADIAVQSTHKTLGAMTQASMLHLQGDRISPDRITNALRLLQSTSPNHILLASLDAARHQMAMQGEALLEKALNLAEEVRDRLANIADLWVFEPTSATIDRTRIAIDATQLGLTGFAADEILYDELGVTAELPELQYLTFVLTFGNTPADCDRLVEAYQILERDRRHLPISPISPILPIPSISSISPREAYFAPTETVAFDLAGDRISAELICPYPPGIPLLMPGEAISAAVLNRLQRIRTLGQTINIEGCSDPTLKTLKVIC
ncbi:MAG: aminotransferase class I/II-fold pyridoxal phosphate-dependent enzyme [Cyanobacteria bacterium P01_E01_bin.42]